MKTLRAASLTPARCKSCGAAIDWTVTEKGKPMPVDLQPVPEGNITIRMHRGPGEPGTARYLGKADLEALHAQHARKVANGFEPPGSVLKLFVSHFATCPNAKEHRRT